MYLQNNRQCILQGRLDALEQRMLSKMDKALANFLEKQLGILPHSVLHVHHVSTVTATGAVLHTATCLLV